MGGEDSCLTPEYYMWLISQDDLKLQSFLNKGLNMQFTNATIV